MKKTFLVCVLCLWASVASAHVSIKDRLEPPVEQRIQRMQAERLIEAFKGWFWKLVEPDPLLPPVPQHQDLIYDENGFIVL